jgi:glycine cleavage system H protein
VTDVPADLRYTAEHEWVLRTGQDTVRVGITDFAQSSLGDVVYVQLPAAGTEVSAGQSFGEVESTKSVSDLCAPVSATVAARPTRAWSTPTPTAGAGSWSCRLTAIPLSRVCPVCSTRTPTAPH